jgi:DNA-binding MarR family transcriptional regulator
LKEKLLKSYNETQLNIGKDILIIHVIGSKIDCSMKDIIIATGLPNSTATRRVGYLIKNNLVIRKISKKDKRKTILKLTRNGRKSFSLFFDYFTQKFEETLQMINEEEKEILIKIFKTLLK